MKKKHFKDILLVILIGTPLFLITIPFVLIAMPFTYFQNRVFEKKYANFLNEINGTNFFCYNSRKNSKKYIDENIIPYLSDKIDIVYLNGKMVESKYQSEFISATLYRLKNYRRFPHLMKIRDGKLIDKSINNPFYNILNLNKPKDKLLKSIHHFFELEEKRTSTKH